jgi:hypothetical protein
MSNREVIDLEEAEEPRTPAPAPPASRACICIDVDAPDPVVEPAQALPTATCSRGAISDLTLQGGIVDSNIRDHAEAIVQQLNCIGVNGRGLAKAVADKFPYGCSYAGRARSDKWGIAAPGSFAVPGSIDVRRPSRPGRQPLVVNFFSQWEMGAPLKYNRAKAPGPPHVQDSAAQRESWFAQCLAQLSSLQPRPASVAFPYLIGCGLGGGSWASYRSMIAAFARDNPSISVLVICGPGDETLEQPRAAQGGGGNARKKPRTSEDARRVMTIKDYF